MVNRFQTQQFDFEWIPASSRVPRDQQKVMIVLHGRGDSLDSFRSVKSDLRLPQMNYLLLNAPRNYDGGFSWYAFEPNQGPGIKKARIKLFALMAELEASGWTSEDVFFIGFSQGCVVSADFGMHYPKPLGGIIGISGYIYFFPAWKKTLTAAAFHTPWLVTHGFFDDLLPLAETRHHIDQLHSVGLPVEFREFNKEHEIDEEFEIPFIRRWLLARLPKARGLKRPLTPKSRALGQRAVLY